MHHRAGVVLKFVHNWDAGIFDERIGCEYILEGSLLLDGEHVNGLLCDHSLLCSRRHCVVVS